MNREDLNITLQSKKEYIDQFINLTLHQFVEGFRSIYENVKNNNSVPKLILKEFQDQLKLIPRWSQNMIDDEYKRIKLMSKCEYLDDLIQAMFASYSQNYHCRYSTGWKIHLLEKFLLLEKQFYENLFL